MSDVCVASEYHHERRGGLKSEGCQYAIAEQIVAVKADYLFSLKGNQGMLHDDVEEYFEA
jgi:hypothetical protein